MEKGTLTKKGKGWQITLESGKSMTIPWRNIPDSWDGAMVEFEKDNTGQASKLKNGDAVIEKMKASPVQQQRQNINYESKFAFSPYNFVPLPSQVLESEAALPFNQYHADRNTGYIDIRIENRTPIFIRGKNENFFEINGVDTIPGSSIRGLISTMVEMLSLSRFENFDNTKYFMRFIADPTGRGYKKHYYQKMGLSEDRDTPVTHKAKAGFLFYNADDFSYGIFPGTGSIRDIPYERGKDFKHEYDEEAGGWKVFSGNMTFRDEETGKKKNKKHWFIPDGYLAIAKIINDKVVQDYVSDKYRDTKKLDILELARNKVGPTKKYKVGVPVFYCEENIEITSFGHTKNYRIPYDNYTGDLVNPAIHNSDNNIDLTERLFGKAASGNRNDDDRIEISGRLFFEDAPRQEVKGDYIYEIPKILSSPKPTSFQLYLEQNGSPKSYDINKANLNYWDTPGAQIRGHKLYWHRVTADVGEHSWIDDQFSVSGEVFNSYYELNRFPPGTFREYNDNELSFIKREDGSTERVFFKKPFSAFPQALKNLLYGLFYPDDKNKRAQSAPIKAIPENNRFDGRIRFENLSDIELGVLLTALALPKGCCHKLGMAKPLGLGTIQITPTLVLSDRNKRYTDLFNEFGAWYQPLVLGKDIDYFKDTFSGFLLASTGETQKNIWEIERFEQLKTMLGFDGAKMADPSWLEKTRYMKIKNRDNKNEFRDRDVLPNPKEVKKL